jgi:GT2 family glycosyltransferase
MDTMDTLRTMNRVRMESESMAPPTKSDALSVSVVIATFRRPELVVQAIDSALAQGSMVKEVVVIDDCPEASAAEAVRRISDSRVLYQRNPEPSGGRPGLVRNLGWPLTSGSVLHFLDDDDLVPSDHYRSALTALAAEPDIGVVFGRVEPFGDEPEKVAAHTAFFDNAARRARSLRSFGVKTAFATEMTFNPVLYVGGAALIRRRCVHAMGGFDADLRVIEDTDFFARAMSRYGARFLDRVTLRYRIGPSITRDPAVNEYVKDSYARMHKNCQDDWGRLQFLARKILARTVFRQPRSQ